MALRIGTEILRIAVSPWLHITNANIEIPKTNCLYVNFLNSVEKYCEMDVISPTQVVRQAKVKMAANNIAPGPANS